MEFLDALDKWVGCAVASAAMIAVAYFWLVMFCRMVSCIWRKDPAWRRHGVALLGDSWALFAVIGLAEWATNSATEADDRADRIDAAIKAGADPFDLNDISQRM